MPCIVIASIAQSFPNHTRRVLLHQISINCNDLLLQKRTINDGHLLVACCVGLLRAHDPWRRRLNQWTRFSIPLKTSISNLINKACLSPTERERFTWAEPRNRRRRVASTPTHAQMRSCRSVGPPGRQRVRKFITGRSRRNNPPRERGRRRHNEGPSHSLQFGRQRHLV